MSSIFDIINVPLGFLLNLFYEWFNNYGVAIIVLAVLLKLITVPASISSQKSMQKMAAVKPLEEKIKREITDKQKQQDEILKLYQEKGVNPAGSCLPTLLPLVLLLGFYNVMRNPLQYMFKLSKDKIFEIYQALLPVADAVKSIDLSKADTAAKQISTVSLHQIEIANAMGAHPDVVSGIEGLKNFAHGINFDFLGMNLSLTPPQPNVWFNGSMTPEMWALISIPIIATLTTFLMSYISQKMTPGMQQTQGGMKLFFYLMPLMTLWISFTVPAALGMYWVISNILGIAQTIWMAKMYPPPPSGSVVTPEGIVEVKPISNNQKKKMQKQALNLARERELEEMLRAEDENSNNDK
jgi:YidC/Oxa1 family membrane protein insertase